MLGSAFAAARTRVPDAPAVACGVRGAVWISAAGEVEALSHAEAAHRLGRGVVALVCHMPTVARRLGLGGLVALDVLELYAFVRPARFVVPTPEGLARTLLVPAPTSLETEAASLFAIARALLAELTASPQRDAEPIAWSMARTGWPWAPAVLSALGARESAALPSGDGLRVWTKIEEWSERSPPPPPEAWPVEAVEARARLVRLLGGAAEPRPQQMAYASHAAAAFQPRDRREAPRIVLAEAGTGVGKTLGYIAPATVWAEKNRGTVWISTYTRNLQRQLDRELDRAYPALGEKARKVVVRKGRDNFFCLLNYEEAVARLDPAAARQTVALALVARWALATRDGDMVGGDFPGWLAGLFGAETIADLTDRRGECTYAGCRHYRRCYVERSIRRARHADIVVANHALVLTRCARSHDDPGQPVRYVFDEAHQLFDAADGAFAWHLSGRETAEVRRWVRGNDDGGRSRRRGLRDRLGDVVADDGAVQEALAEISRGARALPGPGWRQRLLGDAPVGVGERFLSLVRTQVLARSPDGEPGYGIEADVRPPIPGLIDAAVAFAAALDRISRPLATLHAALSARLDQESATLDTALRQRLQGVCRSLEFRLAGPLDGWQAMLRSLPTATPPEYVDVFAIDRLNGAEIDVGFFRHWLDPTEPFARMVLAPAHGALLTSASLRDASDAADDDWAFAEQRTGVHHLDVPPVMSAHASPFDYAAQALILIVGDVSRDVPREVAAAYRELFLAAGGGALGLFTAISRLREIYQAIAAPLEEAGIRLLAQHVDVIDAATLVDIFRDEEDACLLGTDAVRDGVDVPGRSLRLLVLDRVPWPRPTLLHRARRDAFGGRAYDERLARLRLKQAFGRLVRKADDRGVFVLLDRQMPSRLTTAFPPEVRIRRVGLAEAVATVRATVGP